MANPKNYFLAMAVIILVGTHIMSDQRVSGQPSCVNQVAEVIKHCTEFVQKRGPKIPPSTGCCQVLTSIKDDFACVCRYITPNIEKVISMEKAVYVVKTCGIKVQAGDKCGSYTVPAPLA